MRDRSSLTNRILRWQPLQAVLILPNQLLFWIVIISGLLGTPDPQLNIATALTWYIWFCLLFILTVTTGRGWCLVCPFGGLAEWIQQRSFWGRGRPIGLGRPFPTQLARFGYVLPVLALVLLTWIEEYFDVATPGPPRLTSYLVLGIIVLAVMSFLVFERRTFCRYLCPLSGLIGIIGAVAPVSGFRSTSGGTCLDCKTKECLHGSASTRGCPWYAWPGSADTNLSCGLCSGCLVACPKNRVGIQLTPPLDSVVSVRRRRADVAWGVAILLGIVVYQQLNATTWYERGERAANRAMHLSGYPNPLVYLGVITGLALACAVPAIVLAGLLIPRATELPSAGDSFVYRVSRFRTVFLPLMYACIPVVGSDYLSRQLPKFIDNAPKIIPASLELLPFKHPSGSTLVNMRLLGAPAIVGLQVAVMVLGTIASGYAAWRIARLDLGGAARSLVGARIGMTLVTTLLGTGMAGLYVLIRAAE